MNTWRPLDISQLSTPMLFAVWIIILFALTVHEAAHAWMADEAGDDTARLQGRLTLNPGPHIDPLGTVLLPLASLFSGISGFIFWAKPVPFLMHRLRHTSHYMWIALAGPASNVMLALWGVLAFKLLWLLAPNHTALTFAWYFVAMNLFLAAFNMIPIPPLDGSKIFFYLVVKDRPALHPLWEQVERYAFVLLIAVIFVAPIRNATIGPIFRWVFTQMQVVLWM